MLYNVLSPYAVSIDANTFSEAAKNFVKMQRNLDITRIILADRFKNTMRADIGYSIRDGDLIAGISLTPTIYPRTPYPAVVTNSRTMPYPVGVAGMGVAGIGLQPTGLIKTTSDGQQVLPIKDGSLGVGGINANAIAVNPLGLGYAPTLAHYPPTFFNKKQKE